METQIGKTVRTLAGEIAGIPALQLREAIDNPKDKILGSLYIDSDITKPELDDLRQKYRIPQAIELIVPN